LQLSEDESRALSAGSTKPLTKPWAFKQGFRIVYCGKMLFLFQTWKNSKHFWDCFIVSAGKQSCL